MNQLVRQMVLQYRTAGILVDANMLLLYFVGECNPKQIPRFKRTAKFTPEEYEALVEILSLFERVVTIPNVLTEVNSLLRQLPETLYDDYFTTLAHGISVLDEHYVPSRSIAAMAEFPRLGLTDLAIVELIRGRFLVLTDDLPLSIVLWNQGLDVLNWNHIKQELI